MFNEAVYQSTVRNPKSAASFVTQWRWKNTTVVRIIARPPKVCSLTDKPLAAVR